MCLEMCFLPFGDQPMLTQIVAGALVQDWTLAMAAILAGRREPSGELHFLAEWGCLRSHNW